MRIVLDTTFFLPGFHIEISNVPIDALKTMVELSGEDELFLSDMTIFEISAKYVKLFSDEDCADLQKGIDAIVNDSTFTVMASYIQPIWSLACFLRKYHKDFIDCIILATAATKPGIFVSQEKALAQLMTNDLLWQKVEGELSIMRPEMLTFQEWLRKRSS